MCRLGILPFYLLPWNWNHQRFCLGLGFFGFCFYKRTNWKNTHTHTSLQISLSWQWNVKLVLVYILEKGVYLCLFHVPQYLKPLSQKVCYRWSERLLFRLYVFGRHGTFALLTQACCRNLKSVLCIFLQLVRLPDTWRESTFSCAELDVCGVSYFYRTCAQPWIILSLGR